MSKRDFSFLVVGVVVGLGLAYGVFVSPSAEVAEVVEAPEAVEVVEAPEVPSEPTVADIDAERMKLEADQAYLRSEMASSSQDEWPWQFNALQDEHELIVRRLNQLPRERVQAQMRERE